jgi:hypothetical protein
VAPREANRDFPFCSARCRLLDMGRWLDGAYRIPGERAGDGAAGLGEPDEPGAPGGGEDER